MKSGFTAIIGRPNVGKSTLLNCILGQKIVITTDKAQTTRKRIKGIYTNEQGQIVFIDTPGVHKPLNKLGEFLLDEAKVAVDKVKKLGKIDENLLSYKTLFDKNYPVVKISAKTGRNIDTLMKNIFKELPEGDLLYPEDIVTEETMRDVTEEVIREKILINTSDEIPHSVAVKVDKYSESDDIDRIYATIFCEQKSQKGILIGKGGSLLKKIGTEARLELEKIVEKKVFLSLEVKVEKDWRKKQNSLNNFGYKSEN